MQPNKTQWSVYVVGYLVVAMAISSVVGAQAATTELIASGLNRPIYVTGADYPGYGHLLYIAEQSGVIQVMLDGDMQPVPFLDIDSLVRSVSGNSEQGLLGLAFHPEFADNGQFFLNYVDNNGDTVIARYGITNGDPLQANRDSQYTILKISQPYANHNGGWLDFGPDGYLYIAMGDGGSTGDPFNRAQSGSNLFGKILRIDVDGTAPYAIPPDNPFLANPGFLDEIWSYGWRNPWRCSFDRQTGDFWAGDVGQDNWEEVDFEAAGSMGGGNYGWRLMEAADCYNPSTNCDDGSLIHPIHEYSHSEGFAVSGGYVYRGAAIPHFQGQYFFADFVTNRIWSLNHGGATVTDRTLELAPGGGLSIGYIASFGEDAQGELYIVDRGSLSFNGEIWKIISNVSAVSDSPGMLGNMSIGLDSPSPFSLRIAFHVDGARPDGLTVDVFDLSGRRLRRLANGTDGSARLSWDGRDAQGAALASGVYFLRAVQAGQRISRKVILQR